MFALDFPSYFSICLVSPYFLSNLKRERAQTTTSGDKSVDRWEGGRTGGGGKEQEREEVTKVKFPKKKRWNGGGNWKNAKIYTVKGRNEKCKSRSKMHLMNEMWKNGRSAWWDGVRRGRRDMTWSGIRVQASRQAGKQAVQVWWSGAVGWVKYTWESGSLFQISRGGLRWQIQVVWGGVVNWPNALISVYFFSSSLLRRGKGAVWITPFLLPLQHTPIHILPSFPSPL